MPFNHLRDLIQRDVGQRGLARRPGRNLITACPGDLENACRSIGGTSNPVLAIVTGFYIPSAAPPGPETDGPLGAVFLARALFPLGIRVVLATDSFCALALQTGINVCGLRRDVPLVVLPDPNAARALGPAGYVERFLTDAGCQPTHLLAIERVGPSHTLPSLQQQLGSGGALGETYLRFVEAVPDEHQDRCHTMRGIDVTAHMSPAHWLFEGHRALAHVVTLGIGDGGNEIGMGKIPWDVIEDNIPRGGLIACRIATEHLIVAGVSNWGAYALAAGIHALRHNKPTPALFDPAIERKILQAMVDRGMLVDGVLGKPSVSVDGLAWEAYAAALSECGRIVS